MSKADDKAKDFEIVRLAAYKELSALYYKKPNWKSFEADIWEPVKKTVVTLPAYKPQVMPWPKFNEKIAVMSKEAFTGYYSLLAELQFIRNAQKHMKDGKPVTADPRDKHREGLNASIEKTYCEHGNAARLYTRQLYWEFRELGIDHQQTWDVLRNIIVRTVLNYQQTAEDRIDADGLPMNRWETIPRDSLHFDVKPYVELMITGQDATTCKPVTKFMPRNHGIAAHKPHGHAEVTEKEMASIDGFVTDILKISRVDKMQPVVSYSR